MAPTETPAQLLLRYGYQPTLEQPGRDDFLGKTIMRDLDAVQAYVALGMPINQTYKTSFGSYITPLHRAIEHGTPEIVAYLIAAGADIGLRDRLGDTPLHTAVQWCRPAMVELLICAGAELGALSEQDRTGLIAAVRMHGTRHDTDRRAAQQQIIAQLLQAGADPNQPSRDGFTALWHAAVMGDTELVAYLHRAGAALDVVNRAGMPLLVLLARMDHPPRDTFRYLLEAGANPNLADRYGWTALMLARSRELDELAALLEQAGASAPPDARIAFLEAAAHGDLAQVQAYLAQGMPVDVRDWDGTTALGYASDNGHVALAQLLLDAGADIEAADENDLRPLALAAGGQNLAMLQLLLKRGAQVNCGPNSALPWACAAGELEYVRLLLAAGADLHVTSAEGYTCLMGAQRHPDVVAFLLAAGVDLHRRTTDQHAINALWLAADHNCHATMRLLIAAGADLNLRAADTGQTALINASRNQELETMRILLEAGADPHITDNQGQTALDIVMASVRKTQEAIDLLQQYAAA